MLDDSLSPADRMSHDECVSEQKKNTTEIWTQFCKMDPEHFIWGIDPNETPPEVTEKLIFIFDIVFSYFMVRGLLNLRYEQLLLKPSLYI